MPERGNHGDGPEVERSRPSAMIDFTLGPPPLGRLRYGEIRRQMGRRPEAGEEKHEMIGNPLDIDCQLKSINASFR